MAERRKLEIAEKRAKLAAMKKLREEREASARASPVSTRPPSTIEERPASSSSRNDEIENLLRGVGVGGAGGVGGGLSSSLGRSRGSAVDTPVGLSGGTSVAESEDTGQSPTAVEGTERTDAGTSAAVQTSASPVVSTPASPARASTPPPPIPTAPAVVHPPPPPPKVYYDKAIQTSDFSSSSSRHTTTTFGTSTHLDSSSSSPDPNSSAGGAGRESVEELRTRIIAELEEERKQLDLEIAEEKRRADAELERLRAQGLSHPALATVLASPPFLDFLNQSSKIVQRALSDSYDYLRDYTISSTDETGDSDGAKVRLLGSWYDEKWGRGRSVTGVDWSPKFPELFAASYNKNPMAVNEPDGVACVWNLHLRERPEFVFHAQSDVLSVSFTPFHPNLLIGGTYSGQILLWDTRSRHPNPVLKTPLSASGHTHPVYSLSMVGTQNAHNLISGSTDGTICAWTLDMLARPQETLELLHPAHNKTDEVSVTSLGFPEGETSTFWVGTEEGNLYAANRYDRAGAKAGLVQSEVYRGHSGPVTGMSFHPVAGAVDLSDLFLTCGVDWTVKLWRAGGTVVGGGTGGGGGGGSSGVTTGGKSGTTTTTSSSGGATTETSGGGGRSGGAGVVKPLFSFEEADDYVYDVKWHPIHPAMFGSVDGAGKFDLWNLNVDTEVPIVSTPVAPNASRGLNKLAWDRREGRRAAIGSSDGRVYVYEINQDLVTPREGEWEQMRKTCNAALGSSDLPGR